MNSIKTKDPVTIWAEVLNTIFTPIILPTVGVIILFMVSDFSVFPNDNKLLTIWIFFTFSLLLPTILITLFRLYQGWSRQQMLEKERRTVPYALVIICYLFCYYLLCRYQIIYHIRCIIITALITLSCCSLLNQKTNISTHSAAMGGATGLLVIYSLQHFQFNPTWWLCLIIILSGIIGSCQIILHRHTFSQTLIGYCIGIIASILSII